MYLPVSLHKRVFSAYLIGGDIPVPVDVQFGSPIEVTNARRKRWKYVITWKVSILD